MGPAMPLDPNPLVLRAETLVAERETRKAEKMTRRARGKSAEVGKLNWLLQQMHIDGLDKGSHFLLKPISG